jgi:hypothetical protein
MTLDDDLVVARAARLEARGRAARLVQQERERARVSEQLAAADDVLHYVRGDERLAARQHRDGLADQMRELDAELDELRRACPDDATTEVRYRDVLARVEAMLVRDGSAIADGIAALADEMAAARAQLAVLTPVIEVGMAAQAALEAVQVQLAELRAAMAKSWTNVHGSQSVRGHPLYPIVIQLAYVARLKYAEFCDCYAGVGSSATLIAPWTLDDAMFGDIGSPIDTYSTIVVDAVLELRGQAQQLDAGIAELETQRIAMLDPDAARM